MNNYLSRPTAWVTGGSRGIGGAIVEKFEASGYQVKPLSTSDFDLRDRNSVLHFLAQNHNWPDLLVLNAGINNPCRFELQSRESFDEILDVNFHANLELLRTIIPHMQEKGFGRIVVVSSLFAVRAKNGRSAYSGSKAALEAVVRHIALENAKFGILANMISPGFVDTELTRKNNNEKEIEIITNRIPLGRLASPSEIANVVAFLVSSDNTYITGQTINVDGGVYLL